MTRRNDALTRGTATVICLLAAGLLAACSNDTATPQTSPAASRATTAKSPTPEVSEPATTGAWITLADFQKDPTAFHQQGDVVLFFNATWCPTCQETVKNLDRQATPAGLTVVSVDYDSNEALRQQYGVTVQHTFVVIDEDGASEKKFTGALTPEQIAKQAA